MEELIKLISNYGLALVIAGLFLWDWLSNKKEVINILNVIKEQSVNTSKSLDLLQKSMDKHTEKLDKVLERINEK